jgi:hypothetical protein
VAQSRCPYPACPLCGPFRHHCHRQNRDRTMEAVERCRHRVLREHSGCARRLRQRLKPIENFRLHPSLAYWAAAERCRCRYRSANSSGSRRLRFLQVHLELPSTEAEGQWKAIRRKACYLFHLRHPARRAEAGRWRRIRRREIQCFRAFLNPLATTVEVERLPLRPQ